MIIADDVNLNRLKSAFDELQAICIAGPRWTGGISIEVMPR